METFSALLVVCVGNHNNEGIPSGILEVGRRKEISLEGLLLQAHYDILKHVIFTAMIRQFTFQRNIKVLHPDFNKSQRQFQANTGLTLSEEIRSNNQR